MGLLQASTAFHFYTVVYIIIVTRGKLSKVRTCDGAAVGKAGIDVIRDVFGDYAANIQPETIMVRNSQSSAINSDIARLKGARLVTSVEPNEGVRI